MIKRSTSLLLIILLLIVLTSARAATVFSDNFSASTLNSAPPASPTSGATAYHLFSSKGWSPAPTITANDLKFGIAATTSGHIEAQALFTTAPVALTTSGDYVELLVVFTNTTGLFTQAGHVGFGLYNSGGSAPLAGGMNGTAVSGTADVTGGAQGWQGYVSQIACSGGTHRIATRPAQTITTGNNQDLVTDGSGSQSYLNDVQLAGVASTFIQPAAQLTAALRYTLTAPNTLRIESRLYLGGDTNGSLLFNQSAFATGANFLADSFDALGVGWRATANATVSLMDIRSITVNTSVSPGDNPVAGIYFQQQPTDAVAGAPLTPPVTVVATNSIGAPVTNAAITLSLLSGGTPLNGTVSQVTDVNGVATFNDLNLTSAGAKQLRATSGSRTAASAGFVITTAPAATLVFTTQPSDALVSNSIAPPVVVELRDAYGNSVASNATISLTLSSGTGTLSGNASRPTDATGKATFTNLSINLTGAKQLTAAKSGLPSVASASFTINNPSVPAFPGAEGAGANASGGRGGDVYYVTTLANTGAGSLRNGISGAPAGGRTILFKVSGNIVLTSTLTINKPNLTIAGQSAPGDGICLQNYSFNINANNIVLRHIRTRLGTNALQEADAMWINGGTNIVVDHVSASWSVDEVLSASRAVANLTVQNCFITEALNNAIHDKGSHGYGGILSSDNWTTYSYLRNLYAHNRSRNPRIGSSQDPLNPNTLRLDFRNNVIYNYGDRAGYTAGDPESCEVNYVNNYCIKGPSSTYNYILNGGGPTTQVYQSGNFIDLNLNGLLDGADTGWGMFAGTYIQFGTPFSVPAAPTESAPVAYQRVVALSGAMPWRRDSTDQRIAGTVRQQNGMIIDAVSQVGTWPTLATITAPTDTDNDGMPDYWELANGLNPNLATDRNITNTLTGYTRLEDYLNWLADAHALCSKNGFVDVNLRTATGSATNLTYAVANGLNGTVSLLGDGYTTRFAATANTNGIANFSFTATGDGITFGPMTHGILITTTNAPVLNTPPVLAAITNRTLIAGNPVNFTCSVTDTDAPPQTITFTLQSGPTNATLGSSSGTFNWRPTIAQSNTTNSMSIIATDNGSPTMSATQSFTLTVLRPAPPNLQSVAFTGGALQLQVTGDAGPDYAVEASTNLVNWTLLATTNSPVLPWLWTDPQPATLPARFYRIKLGP